MDGWAGKKAMTEEATEQVLICKGCGTRIVLKFNASDYRRWKEGELIQRAMPYLTPNEREILITGVCGKCFDAMFSE